MILFRNRRFRFKPTRGLNFYSGLPVLAFILLITICLGVGLFQLWELFFHNELYDTNKLYPWSVGKTFALLFIVVFFYIDISSDNILINFFHVLRVIVFALLCFLGAGVLCYYYVLPHLVVGWNFLYTNYYSYPLQAPFVALVSVISVICAYVAFLLRRSRGRLYGHLEILFGIIAIASSVYQSYGDYTRIGIGFFAGAYIIVRGLSNIEDGLDEKPLNLGKYAISFLNDFLLYPFFEPPKYSRPVIDSPSPKGRPRNTS
jgi:hypothetical protein